MAGSGSPQKDASDLSGSNHKKHKADRLPFVPPPPPPPPPNRLRSLPRSRVKRQTSLWLSPLSPEQEKQLKEFHKVVYESGGFDVSFVPHIPGMTLPFHPVTIDNTPGSFYVDLIASATLAIYHYNHRETPKRYFEFSKLLKATFTLVNGSDFNITFEATEQGRLGGPAAINTFQTVVYCRFDNRLQVEFCRLMDENKKKSGMTGSTSPTTADWRSRDLEKRNHEPYPFDCMHSLDDLDVKTAATVATFILYDPKKTEYMFSKLVSAFSTTTDGARIFKITFEATDREKDRNVVRTFEAVVWQIYPSFNLQIEYSRLKNEEEGASGLDA